MWSKFAFGKFIFIELFRSASDDQIDQEKKTHSGHWCNVLHIENKIGADGIGEITRIADPGGHFGFFLANTK